MTRKKHTFKDVEHSSYSQDGLSEQIKPKGRSCLCKCCIIITIMIVILLILAFLLIFVGIPVYLMNAIELQTDLVFMPDETSAKKFINPTNYANGSRNLYVNVNKADNITLGVWHFLPDALVSQSMEDANFNYSEALASSDYPVLLFFHGNGGNRLNNLPVMLNLRRTFHIIAFDYRGYGDSSKAELTEENIVRDSLEFCKWLNSRTAPNNTYVWGHSLGSALSTYTLARLTQEDLKPMGLILEAPFLSLRAMVMHVAKFIAWVPWFEATVLEGFEKNGFNFKTNENILKVDCPIMILHAEDDVIIPYTQGEELAKVAQENRDPVKQGQVIFHLFSSKFKYSHWGITDAPEMGGYLRNFIGICRTFKGNSGKLEQTTTTESSTSTVTVQNGTTLLPTTL